MDDPVADILTQRASMGSGASLAVIVSLLAHAGASALAVWAAWHHATTQAPAVMNIRFAQPASVTIPAAQPAPVPTPQPIAQQPAPVQPQAVKKPVAASPFGKSTKKETPPAPNVAAQPSPAVPAVDTTGPLSSTLETDFPYPIYIDRMKTIIGSHWLRPQASSGIVTSVYFVIERDGTLRDAKVDIESGNGTFDRAALRAVLESSPLPPLPFGYSGTYLGVHLTFR